MGKHSKYAIAENHTFVLQNVVRHTSDQLYRVTFEIITPFVGFTAKCLNTLKNI